MKKIVLSHPWDRPARKVKELNDAPNEILITKIILPKKINEMPLHPRKRKTLKEQKIAAKNSEALLSNFEFDPEEILDKILLSDLKKTSEKKIIDRLIENFPKGNDQYYIEHRESTNSFQVRHNRNQKEKEDLFEFIFNADKKIARRKHKHSKS